jgi:hypothetical protein
MDLDVPGGQICFANRKFEPLQEERMRRGSGTYGREEKFMWGIGREI